MESEESMSYKHIIDNKRISLSETLREIAKDFDELSIATGYWDLAGTAEILETLKNYKRIRLLIGQEPLSPRNSKLLGIEMPDADFPDKDIVHDLEQISDFNLRETVKELKQLISNGVLEVKVYKRSFLHAKTYIFGSEESDGAVGIIGSSNFTKAGLTSNTELNSLEDESRIVKYIPRVDSDEHGHMSWFNEVWSDVNNVAWTGEFTRILSDSPVGDLCFGAYDSYIRTLMEVYPDELIPKEELSNDISDVLFSFQHRNAQILINKLERMGLAMLADSVGLGKTITAGAVINHYKNKGYTRIYIISPASLKSQWQQDLADKFKLIQGFEVISLQDSKAIEKARMLDKYKTVDLFVIDEAHNLRNFNSKRHQQLLEWFINNPDSKILMLTATPINNSLMDFVNQIQLASKGNLESINVDYKDENGQILKVDFFYALSQIQNRVKRAEKNGEDFDWKTIANVISSGLRHYLVRTTRQGVKKSGGIVLSDGTRMDFPESVVGQIGYQFSGHSITISKKIIEQNEKIFEGIDPNNLSLEDLLNQTQRSAHPLDLCANLQNDTKTHQKINLFSTIYKIVLLIGFTPYRPEIYKHRIHNKSIEDIRALGLVGEESARVQSQLSIHNMLRISWLKRLESSQWALHQSLKNYVQRLDKFEHFLRQGKILTPSEIDEILGIYGEDVDVTELSDLEVVEADPAIFKLEDLKNDLVRDRKLANLLISVLSSIEMQDTKLFELAKFIREGASNVDIAKRKILVFSYYSDTIKYLEKALPKLLDDIDFESRAEFVTGGTANVESITGRFAPKAKKYEFNDGESEVDFLFATDVLSEGQNLQDAGSLINYDLHWNPVRMIQRNGRINRLGSEFANVYISNMKPEDTLEEYLKLVNRLNSKINTIKNSIGLDQDVLEKGQVDAKEFVENYDENGLIKLLSHEENVKNEGIKDSGELDIASLYGEKATQFLAQIEEEESKFFAEDDFIYDLREFLMKFQDDPDTITRVKSIPLGKWNYLPLIQRQDERRNCIGLARTSGVTSLTGIEVTDTYFVEVDTSDPNFRTRNLEDSVFLTKIKTSSNDNLRMLDEIAVDRNLVKKRVLAAAKAQAGRNLQNIKPKRFELEMLGEFEKMMPGSSLLILITERITNKHELKLFQKLMRKSKLELKTHGHILGSSISEMQKLAQELSNKQYETTNVEDVSGVLFYASR